nr:sodium/glutamate symporter [Muriicola sp. Z0-33]
MEIGPRDTIVIACLVLFLGKYINKKISFFRAYNIPEPVTGGVIFSIFFGVLYAFTGIEVNFALELRDALLIIFFITIGLSSRLKTLLKGGKSLILLLVLAVGYLFIQNLNGIGIAYITGMPSVTGILGGSVSFSGVMAPQLHGYLLFKMILAFRMPWKWVLPARPLVWYLEALLEVLLRNF